MRQTTEQEVLKQFRILLQSIRKHFQEVEQRCGVSGAQLWALSYLSQHPNARLSDVAQAMTIHQSTASNLIEKLVELGLVQRKRCERDQRAVALELSAQGEQALRLAPAPFQGVLPDALTRLEDKQLEVLHEHLSALLAVMAHTDSRSGNKPLSDL